MKQGWLPFPVLIFSSYIDYEAMYDESIKNPTEFWSRQAKKFLKWIKIFDEVDGCRLEEGVISWFTGGQLNVSCKPLVV